MISEMAKIPMLNSGTFAQINFASSSESSDGSDSSEVNLFNHKTLCPAVTMPSVSTPASLLTLLLLLYSSSRQYLAVAEMQSMHCCSDSI